MSMRIPLSVKFLAKRNTLKVRPRFVRPKYGTFVFVYFFSYFESDAETTLNPTRVCTTIPVKFNSNEIPWFENWNSSWELIKTAIKQKRDKWERTTFNNSQEKNSKCYKDMINNWNNNHTETQARYTFLSIEHKYITSISRYCKIVNIPKVIYSEKRSVFSNIYMRIKLIKHSFTRSYNKQYYHSEALLIFYSCKIYLLSSK